ncbi:MAG: gyrase inhibitory protein, gyri [Firmicutes bacterium]|nr:gyrase inhibitory protein, gyri [Bacillota bacterium]
MQFTIETIPRQTVAYIRRTGPYGANNMDLMERLKSWAGANNILDKSTVIMGIAHDDPAITLPDACRYDVCIVVPGKYEIKGEDINKTELSGGKYAIFMIGHTTEDIQKAWADILPELSGQGLCIDNSRPIFERYTPGMVSNHQCEICVPI